MEPPAGPGVPPVTLTGRAAAGIDHLDEGHAPELVDLTGGHGGRVDHVCPGAQDCRGQCRLPGADLEENEVVARGNRGRLGPGPEGCADRGAGGVPGSVQEEDRSLV